MKQFPLQIFFLSMIAANGLHAANNKRPPDQVQIGEQSLDQGLVATQTIAVDGSFASRLCAR
jgi:hypothetical protein